MSQQSRWTQLSRKSFSKRILSTKEIEDMDAWPLNAFKRCLKRVSAGA